MSVGNSLCFSKSAAQRDKSREWGRLEAKAESLLTLSNSGDLGPAARKNRGQM